MRFYVICRIHPNEKIYIKFEPEPQTRAEIPIYFSATCPIGIQNKYTNSEVIAEIGAEKIGLAALVTIGAFLIDPVLGILSILGSTAYGASEKSKVDKFNNS
jgi:hypothetical protein